MNDHDYLAVYLAVLPLHLSFILIIDIQIVLLSPDIVGHRKCCPAVEQNFDDFVVVPVGRQHQRRDVRGERRRLRGNRLPTLKARLD